MSEHLTDDERYIKTVNFIESTENSTLSSVWFRGAWYEQQKVINNLRQQIKANEHLLSEKVKERLESIQGCLWVELGGITIEEAMKKLDQTKADKREIDE